MQYITVSGNQNNDIYDDGYLRIEHENHYVSCGGRYVSLSRKEFLIISRLARNPDRVVTYQEIWQHAWGKKSAFNPKSLRVYVYRLRNRLASSGISIESMVNVGYRLRIPALVGGNRTDATSDRL
ncbi:MAG: winged helix-turn-helix domain-containing protein [Blastocatellia bacterium]|nr:winged helix-turn-helix domain-containing protein [Blastocatellia bacterium]